jgi:hypothetical protein
VLEAQVLLSVQIVNVVIVVVIVYANYGGCQRMSACCAVSVCSFQCAVVEDETAASLFTYETSVTYSHNKS